MQWPHGSTGIMPVILEQQLGHSIWSTRLPWPSVDGVDISFGWHYENSTWFILSTNTVHASQRKFYCKFFWVDLKNFMNSLLIITGLDLGFSQGGKINQRFWMLWNNTKEGPFSWWRGQICKAEKLSPFPLNPTLFQIWLNLKLIFWYQKFFILFTWPVRIFLDSFWPVRICFILAENFPFYYWVSDTHSNKNHWKCFFFFWKNNSKWCSTHSELKITAICNLNQRFFSTLFQRGFSSLEKNIFEPKICLKPWCDDYSIWTSYNKNVYHSIPYKKSLSYISMHGF